MVLLLLGTCVIFTHCINWAEWDFDLSKTIFFVAFLQDKKSLSYTFSYLAPNFGTPFQSTSGNHFQGTSYSQHPSCSCPVLWFPPSFVKALYTILLSFLVEQDVNSWCFVLKKKKKINQKLCIHAFPHLGFPMHLDLHHLQNVLCVLLLESDGSYFFSNAGFLIN